MNSDATTLRNLSLDHFTNIAISNPPVFEPIAKFSDSRLIEAAIDAIKNPKITSSPNSFLLHAPLELLARAALLPRVAPESRSTARLRIAEIAARYAHSGEEMEMDAATKEESRATPHDLAHILMTEREPHNHAQFLKVLNKNSLASLATQLFDATTTSLAVAGHAPILFAELLRVTGRIHNAGLLLLAPLRYSALHSTLTLKWVDDHLALQHPPKIDEAQALAATLSNAATIAVPNHSIATTVLAPEASGGYTRDLGDYAFRDLNEIERVLLRAAALSMLQDDPSHAAYGWTHCLTMPLALTTLAAASSHPARAIAMASAEVYAFRATMGMVTIDFDWKPEPPRHRDWAVATPREAASIAYHAQPQERIEVRTKLASYAATHRDAHLVKYTVACFDAASRDPEQQSLYLAAASYLAAWWRDRDTCTN